MTADLKALAERVEGLTGPCPETDGLVFKALVEEPGDVWSEDFDGWARQDPEDASMWELAPEFTASLDAVVALAAKRMPNAWTETLHRAIKAVWEKHSMHIRHHKVEPDELARITLAATLRALATENADDRA